MILIRNLAIALALAAVASPGHAQDRNQGAARTDENGQPLLQVVVRPDAGTAQRTELATRLIQLSAGPNFQKDMEALITAQLNQLEGSAQHRREADWMRANAPRMLTSMTERMLADLAPRYADIYTTEELEAQIAFFDSPIGRRISTKSVQLGMASQEVMTDSLQSFVTELATKYCAQFDCETNAGQAAAKPQRR